MERTTEQATVPPVPPIDPPPIDPAPLPPDPGVPVPPQRGPVPEPAPA